MAFYQIELQPDESVWLVTSEDFPELTTFGETKEAALKNAQKAIEEAIAGRIADKEDIPLPLNDPGERGFFVEIPMMVFLKSALYMILKGSGMTRADLQRALGWHREQVDRLFRLDHQTNLDSLEEAFKALGTRARVEVPFPKAA